MDGQRSRWKSESHFPSISFCELAGNKHTFEKNVAPSSIKYRRLFGSLLQHQESSGRIITKGKPWMKFFSIRRQPLTTGIMDKRSRVAAGGGFPSPELAGSPVVSRAVGFIFGCSSLLLSVLMGIFFFKDIQH